MNIDTASFLSVAETSVVTHAHHLVVFIFNSIIEPSSLVTIHVGQPT